MVALGSTRGSLGKDAEIGRAESEGGPHPARISASGSGCAPRPPPRQRRLYLKQVRSQLLGDAVQGPGAAWLSPRVS